MVQYVICDRTSGEKLGWGTRGLNAQDALAEYLREHPRRKAEELRTVDSETQHAEETAIKAAEARGGLADKMLLMDSIVEGARLIVESNFGEDGEAQAALWWYLGGVVSWWALTKPAITKLLDTNQPDSALDDLGWIGQVLEKYGQYLGKKYGTSSALVSAYQKVREEMDELLAPIGWDAENRAKGLVPV